MHRILVLALTSAAATACVADDPWIAESSHALDLEQWDQDCWFNDGLTPRHWEDPDGDIYVYVNVSSTDGVHLSGHDTWDFAATVQSALSVWNEDGGTPLRLRYGGSTLEPSEDGAIVILGGLGCADGGGTADTQPKDGAVIQSATVLITSCVSGAVPDHIGSPAKLLDLLVHELGHTMGRNDAYKHAPECPAETIMQDNQRALTGFDKTQHQAVYGSRAPATTPVRRSRGTTGSWSAPVTLGVDGALYRVGSSSSYRSYANTLAWPLDAGDYTTVLDKRRLVWGTLVDGEELDIETHNPTASAMSPSGVGILAYQVELAEDRAVCYRYTADYGVSYGEEICFGNTFRSGVSAAFDPVSGYFLLGYADNVRRPVVRVIPADPSPLWPAINHVISGETTSDAPGIACAPGFSFENKNCRVVWADSSDYGQPVRWQEFEVPVGGGYLVGPTRSSQVLSDEAPAVTWFGDRFQLGVLRWSQYIYQYDMPRTGTGWSYRSTLNNAGYVSAPSLLTERLCIWSCVETMYAHWLRYE